MARTRHEHTDLISASAAEAAIPEHALQAPTHTTDGPWLAWFDRVIGAQRPAVLHHVRAIRRRHPEATPRELIVTLEREYLAAVTTGGAAVGASAVIPGFGFVAALGLSGADTAVFLEASALFAQSVAEVHGMSVDDPERARTLVMAMMLGTPGSDLVKQFAGQALGGPARTVFWGELVTSSLPKQVVTGIGGKLRASFVKRFVTRHGASLIGRAMPFGVGAVVGGVGNHTLGRQVVRSSRSAFGLPPEVFPRTLDAASRETGDGGSEAPVGASAKRDAISAEAISAQSESAQSESAQSESAEPNRRRRRRR